MTMKSKMRSAVKGQNLPSNSPDATMNRAGGVAFEINDPATKLVTMTGGSFFMEPKYYDGILAAKRVAAGSDAATMEKFEKLKERVRVNENSFKGVDVDEVTKEILGTAGKIAQGPNPEDLLIIAKWLRSDMNIRATPQALLVVASRFDATKPFVRKYAPHIVVRPDEVKTCVLMHRFFFGMKSLKNCLANGLSDAMSKFGERALLKYDSDGWPTFRDVLQILPRGKGRPLPRELANYFLKGEVEDAQKTPIIAARKALAGVSQFDANAQELALKSLVNWEVLLSQFGKEKTKVWEFLMKNDLVGYMALMRNLRNMVEAGVSAETVKMAAAKLSDPKQVARARQLPFRYLMAHQILTGHSGNSRVLSKMMEAVETASNLSVENLPVLPGLTAIFADNSGSMSCTVSGKSKMTCAGAANALCGIVAKQSEDAIVAAFATDPAPVKFTRHDTVISVANKVAKADTHGWATDAYKIPLLLKKMGLKPDRVIILSDMQCWNSGGWGSSKPLCDTWEQFKKYSPDTWLHSIHLNGSGDTPVKADKVNLTAGFSEKVFDMLLQAEGVTPAGQVEPVPTIEQIRQSHKL